MGEGDMGGAGGRVGLAWSRSPGSERAVSACLESVFIKHLYDAYWGKDVGRSQQVLEDHLSRVTSLLVPSGLCTPAFLTGLTQPVAVVMQKSPSL